VQPRRHHPLVATLLGVVAAVASVRAGIRPGLLKASEIGLDRVWKGPRTYPIGRGGNGSARVKRAALKARNVQRNRRAHRG
jgi:hypothetical protein